jgi:hypothetical protein
MGEHGGEHGRAPGVAGAPLIRSFAAVHGY